MDEAAIERVIAAAGDIPDGEVDCPPHGMVSRRDAIVVELLNVADALDAPPLVAYKQAELRGELEKIAKLAADLIEMLGFDRPVGHDKKEPNILPTPSRALMQHYPLNDWRSKQVVNALTVAKPLDDMAMLEIAKAIAILRNKAVIAGYAAKDTEVKDKPPSPLVIAPYGLILAGNEDSGWIAVKGACRVWVDVLGRELKVSTNQDTGHATGPFVRFARAWVDALGVEITATAIRDRVTTIRKMQENFWENS